MTISTILIPVDGSEGATVAARFGAELAEKFGASVELLHVYNVSSLALMGLTALSKEEIEHKVDLVSDVHFEKAKKAIEGRNVEVRTAVEMGTPSEEIISYVDRNPVDLIVMGRRGMTTFENLVMGSVSSQVIGHASCPVTIVR